MAVPLEARYGGTRALLISFGAPMPPEIETRHEGLRGIPRLYRIIMRRFSNIQRVPKDPSCWALRSAFTASVPPMTPFTLHIGDDIQRKLDRCTALMRTSIRKRLQTTVDDLTNAKAPPGRRAAKSPAVVPFGPPLRFYVWEGYRVSYRVDPVDRSVVVLELIPQRD